MRAINLIFWKRLASATLINVNASAVIQCASDRPCNSFPSKTFPCRVRGPNLVLIDCNGTLSQAIMPVFLCRIHGSVGNFSNNFTALRYSVRRADVVGSANHIRRFKAPSRDHFHCHRLGLVSIAGRVVNFEDFECFALVIVNFAIVSEARHPLNVFSNQGVLRRARATGVIDAVNGGRQPIYQHFLSCGRVNTYLSMRDRCHR